MLSEFLKKLMFIRQFFVIDGRIEVLGVKNVMLSSAGVSLLQENNSDLVYSIFKDSMKKDAASYAAHLGTTREGIVNTIKNLFELFGLGQLKIVDLDDKSKKAIVEVYDSVFANYYIQNKKPSKTPTCIVTAGVLAGIFSFTLDSDVDAVEKRCLTLGDNCCQFIIKQK